MYNNDYGGLVGCGYRLLGGQMWVLTDQQRGRAVIRDADAAGWRLSGSWMSLRRRGVLVAKCRRRRGGGSRGGRPEGEEEMGVG